MGPPTSEDPPCPGPGERPTPPRLPPPTGHLQGCEHHHFLLSAVGLLQQHIPPSLLVQLGQPHRICLGIQVEEAVVLKAQPEHVPSCDPLLHEAPRRVQPPAVELGLVQQGAGPRQALEQGGVGRRLWPAQHVVAGFRLGAVREVGWHPPEQGRCHAPSQDDLGQVIQLLFRLLVLLLLLLLLRSPEQR